MEAIDGVAWSSPRRKGSQSLHIPWSTVLYCMYMLQPALDACTDTVLYKVQIEQERNRATTNTRICTQVQVHEYALMRYYATTGYCRVQCFTLSPLHFPLSLNTTRTRTWSLEEAFQKDHLDC